MNFRGISALLLFSCTIPVVTKYKIFPTEETPYWLFGILFLSLIGFSLLSLYPQIKKNFLRSFLFWLCIGISLGGPSITAISERHRVAPVWMTHDIILQQEAAMRYLLQGKNPYKETYFGTPVEMFNYDEIGNTEAINPALYHFVMPPGYLLIPFPFYWVANRIFGYFDGRMVLIVLMGVTLFVLSRWFKRKDVAETAIVFTALSPASVDFFIEGRSDMFALAMLISALFFLQRKRIYLSAGIFSLAILSKQTMWFSIPLYIAFLYALLRDLRKLFGPLALMCLIGMVFTGPFLLWDVRAFIESVILYLSAGGERGYPVNGYGLSMILYSWGIIKDIHEYYPFFVWQGIIGCLAIIGTMKYFMSNPSMSRFFVGFAITLFAFWYTSRYFNNSHIATVAGLFGLGILKHYDEAS
jgi:hypothetical protein